MKRGKLFRLSDQFKSDQKLMDFLFGGEMKVVTAPHLLSAAENAEPVRPEFTHDDAFKLSPALPSFLILILEHQSQCLLHMGKLTDNAVNHV